MPSHSVENANLTTFRCHLNAFESLEMHQHHMLVNLAQREMSKGWMSNISQKHDQKDS